MAVRVSLIVGLLGIAGCAAPWIQLPSLYPANPEAERASYTYHDPLPDSSLGPNVFARPRDAATQRSEPRRTMEASIPGPTASDGPARQIYMAPPQSNYPNTISP